MYILQLEKAATDHHVQIYALFNCIMNLVESATWIVGIYVVPVEYRYIVFVAGVLWGLRIPRAFLANDFHGMCFTKAWNAVAGALF
jgi:hypothetical protein